MSIFDNCTPEFAAEVCAEAWKNLERRLHLCDMALNEPHPALREKALKLVKKRHRQNEGINKNCPYRKYTEWRAYR